MSRVSSVFNNPYEPNSNKRAIQAAQYAIDGIGRLQEISYEKFSFDYQGKSNHLEESVQNILFNAKGSLEVETVDKLKVLAGDVSNKVKELECALSSVIPLMQKVIEECEDAEKERLEDEKSAKEDLKEKILEPPEKKRKNHRY